MSHENQGVWKYEFSFRIENNSLWYNNICCSIGHMSELTWAAASCVDWLFSCMSFCAFEKFIDDTYNRVERRVNAVKSFLFLTSHTAWTVNFVINLLLPTLLLPIKWSTTPNFIQAWPSYIGKRRVGNSGFNTKLTVQAAWDVKNRKDFTAFTRRSTRL